MVWKITLLDPLSIQEIEQGEAEVLIRKSLNAVIFETKIVAKKTFFFVPTYITQILYSNRLRKMLILRQKFTIKCVSEYKEHLGKEGTKFSVKEKLIYLLKALCFVIT